MIEILNRYTGTVLYSGPTANTITEGVQEAIKSGADLRKADLHGADLCKADLHGADLRKADLHGADLCKADLSEANLHGADLHGADLSEADLREANLCEANLYKADLHGADLCKADLSEANLHGADLHGADLSEADLREANLHGADLSEADLRKANLQGVLAEHCSRILTASGGSGYHMVLVHHPDGVSMHAGCRNFTSLAKARDHWRERLGHAPEHLADCIAALDYLEALATRRGWNLGESDSEAAA